jgi:GNAT superfamily N-acetyltransferase
MSSSLPDGYRCRPVKPADASVINALIVAADEAVQGWSDSSEQDILDWWRLLDLEQDSWIVEDSGIAAYAVAFPHADSLDVDGYVHPSHKRRGLGSWLVARGEERAVGRGLPTVHGWALAQDADARRLFEERGYAEVRRFYRMLIELEAPPPEPEWPEGFRVVTFEHEDARAIHAAFLEVFADEWNFVAMPFEQWYEVRVAEPDFDPTLWFVVRRGDEIAAVLRADLERSGAGYVAGIGVLKKWRRRGLGLALLRQVFGEFYRRGQPRIALGVDAQNPTGATKLYERAGMHVAYEGIAFAKELT